MRTTSSRAAARTARRIRLVAASLGAWRPQPLKRRHEVLLKPCRIECAPGFGLSQGIENGTRQGARSIGEGSSIGVAQDRGVSPTNGFEIASADKLLSGKFNGDHFLRNKTVDRHENRDQEGAAEQHELGAGREVLEHWTTQVTR